MPPGKRQKWLAAEEGLKRFDLPDTVAGRRRMVERLDRRAVEEEIKKCGMPVIASKNLVTKHKHGDRLKLSFVTNFSRYHLCERLKYFFVPAW